MRRTDTAAAHAARRSAQGSLVSGFVSLFLAAVPLGVFVWAVLMIGGFFAA